MYKVSPFMRVCLNLWAWCVVFLFLGALLASGAHAQALPAGVSPVFAPSVAGNVVTYSGGTATAANASSVAFPPPANGSVYAEAAQSVAVGDSRTAAIAVRSRPSAAVIARAVGNFALKTAGALVIAKNLYDLCNELGYNCARVNDTGPAVVTKVDPLVCGTAPCYEWFMYGVGQRGPFSTPSQACGTNWGALLEYYSPRLKGGPSVMYEGGNYACAGMLDGNYTAVFGVVRGASVPPVPASAPSSVQELQDAIAAKSGWPETSAIGKVLADAVASGETIELPRPYQITGPLEVPLAPSITAWPDGSSTTDQRTKKLAYGPDSVTVTEESKKTTTSPSGVVAPVSTTVTGNPLPTQPTTAAATPDIKTCGYPGGPACKIDETGTPEALPKGQYLPSLDDYKAKADENRTTIGGNGDKPFFTGWNLFFFAPALASCEPIKLPDYKGAPMGQLDACDVVDGTRSVMSYIWALGALFLCLGMIKKVV